MFLLSESNRNLEVVVNDMTMKTEMNDTAFHIMNILACYVCTKDKFSQSQNITRLVLKYSLYLYIFDRFHIHFCERQIKLL